MEIGEKFLPIGSVVLLKGGSKRVMIIGFCPVTAENKAYDYTASLYPEGIISSKESLLFNHEDIAQVISVGYKDAEYDSFIAKLKDVLAKNASAESSSTEVSSNTSVPNLDYQVENKPVTEQSSDDDISII